MKKYLILITGWIISSHFLPAQTTINGSFIFGGITRTYSFYVPAAYTPGNAVPLVFNLHGLGTDGAYQAQYRDFRPIADTAHFIVVHPDGSELLGQKFWNYGNVFGSTVDDVGFLEALADTIAAQYTINPARVYAAGMSNGSFMCYYLACQSNRFAAIGTVAGTMSLTMYTNCNPQYPIPTLHIHGTEDNINPYAGSALNQGADDITAFWVDKNNCNPTPTTINLPDVVTTDSSTAEWQVYTGGVNGHTVELFKVYGGGHAWPGSPAPSSAEVTCMDFDASKEIWRFFSQYERHDIGFENEKQPEIKIWPNPTREYVFIEGNGAYISELVVTDMLGKICLQWNKNIPTAIPVYTLTPGCYLIHIRGEHVNATQKLMVDEK